MILKDCYNCLKLNRINKGVCKVYQMKKYVIYYRVSTKRQGESGLGLEAQEFDINLYLSNYEREGEYEVIHEITDVRSGKGMLDVRPELREAVELASKEGATLLVSKLDRLSRDVELIAHLIKKIRLKVARFPHAGNFELHLHAALAEQEAEFISERTKAALANSTKKLGGYRGKTKERNGELHKANYAKALEYKDFICQCIREGMNQKKIAEMMNAAGYKSSQGGKIHPTTVSRFVKMLKAAGVLL